MARFARDCLYRFGILTKQLETELGPGTGDLGLRIGLHSGAGEFCWRREPLNETTRTLILLTYPFFSLLSCFLCMHSSQVAPQPL